MYFLSKIIAKEESFNIFHHPNLEKMSSNAIIYYNLSERPQKKSSIFYQNILKSVFLRNLIFLAKTSLSTIFDQKILEIIFKKSQNFSLGGPCKQLLLSISSTKQYKNTQLLVGRTFTFFFSKIHDFAFGSPLLLRRPCKIDRRLHYFLHYFFKKI